MTQFLSADDNGARARPGPGGNNNSPNSIDFGAKPARAAAKARRQPYFPTAAKEMIHILHQKARQKKKGGSATKAYSMEKFNGFGNN